VWNSFIKLGLPVLALALVALQGGATGGRVVVALLGIAGLVAAVVVFALMLRSEDVARRFGLLAGRVASRLLRLLRRPPVAGWELATVKFRTRTVGLVERRWIAITVTSLVSHLSLYLVLLVTLRQSGSATPRSPGPRCWPCSPSPGWPRPSRSPPAAPGSSRPC
jgi:putative heme transporter